MGLITFKTRFQMLKKWSYSAGVLSKDTSCLFSRAMLTSLTDQRNIFFPIVIVFNAYSMFIL